MLHRLWLAGRLSIFGSVLSMGPAFAQAPAGDVKPPEPPVVAPASSAPPTVVAQPAPAVPQPGQAPPMAAAQPAAPAAPPVPIAAPEQRGTPATVLDVVDSDGIIGKNIRSSAGEDMGRIVDVIVSGNSRVEAVVIDFGGFLGVGSRKIAVDWRALHFAMDGKAGRITLALTRNQVRVSPEYKPGEPIVVLGMAPSNPADTSASQQTAAQAPPAPPATAALVSSPQPTAPVQPAAPAQPAPTQPVPAATPSAPATPPPPATPANP